MVASSLLPTVRVWVFCTSWACSVASSVKHNTQGVTPFASFNLDKSCLPLLPPISELMAPAGRSLGHCAAEQSEGFYFPGANQWNPYSSWRCLSLEESGSDNRWTFHLKTQLKLLPCAVSVNGILKMKLWNQNGLWRHCVRLKAQMCNTMPPKTKNMLRTQLKCTFNLSGNSPLKLKRASSTFKSSFACLKVLIGFPNLAAALTFWPCREGLCGCSRVLTTEIGSESSQSCRGCILLNAPLRCAQLDLVSRAFGDQVKALGS